MKSKSKTSKVGLMRSSSRKSKPASARLSIIKRSSSSSLKSPGTVNKVARGVGSAIGSVFGGPQLGQSLGDASSWLAKIMGFGDYNVNNNTLMCNSEQIPSFSTNGDDVIIKHREFIKDVSSSELFSNDTHLINPGNSDLFPWLSGIASSFEEYQFLGLIFEFKTTSSVALNSTNTALGTVIMATDYDSVDAAYANKRSMENSQFWTSSAPSASMIHPIECKPNSSVLNRFFVTSARYSGAVTGDPRLYFMGLFQLATVGMQNVNIIGELSVSYQVRFSKPQLPLAAVQHYLINYDLYIDRSSVNNLTVASERDTDIGVQTVILGIPNDISQVRNKVLFKDSRSYGRVYTLVYTSSFPFPNQNNGNTNTGRFFESSGINVINTRQLGDVAYYSSDRIAWQNGDPTATSPLSTNNCIFTVKFQVQLFPTTQPYISFQPFIFDGSNTTNKIEICPSVYDPVSESGVSNPSSTFLKVPRFIYQTNKISDSKDEAHGETPLSYTRINQKEDNSTSLSDDDYTKVSPSFSTKELLLIIDSLTKDKNNTCSH